MDKNGYTICGIGSDIMEPLPTNWNEMTHKEKDFFFSRFYNHYLRPGECVGIWDDADDEVKKAYEEFLKEDDK